MRGRTRAPEPLTFQEAHQIRWQARRGHPATAELTERLAHQVMLSLIAVHVCGPDDIESADGLAR